MSELSNKELKIRVKQRGILRARITKELTNIDSAFASTPPDLEAAKIVAGNLQAFLQSLIEFDETIVANTEEEKLDEEIERAEKYKYEITYGLSAIEARRETFLNASTPPSPTPVGPNFHQDLTPKLPKLEIPKYNGDPLLWDEFWDNFSSSIHDRSDLPTIDKFKYLKSFLDGEALRLADGYRLTVPNYGEVVEALKERFGDPELATFSHFEALISLKPATYSLCELRAVLDKCESHIRSLVALGLPEKTFGVVFTPLILSKLPKGVKIEMHRKNGSTPWRLQSLRTLLKEEISAREKGERVFGASADRNVSEEVKLKPKPQEFVSRRRPITSSSLTSPTDTTPKHSATICVFCSGKHFSSSCRTYPDFESRLKQVQGRCHSCLRTGHRVPQCRSKRPCFFCHRDTHHQSLCRKQFESKSDDKDSSMVSSSTKGNTNEKPSSAAGKAESNLSLQTPNSESVLQTALANIRGSRGEMTARMYFDTGGSRSFISTTAAKAIGAKRVGKETVSVGRFRDSKRSTVTYDIYEFEICLPNGGSKKVRMSSEASISCPIQLIPLDPNCSVLSQVKLAEPLVRSPTMVPIDILIGNDYYYSFIGYEQLRCPNGVVLLESPFGFITGGSLATIGKSRQFDATFFITASKASQSTYGLERFWELENIGIKDDCHQNDDEKAMRMFNDSVKLEDSRYVVKWPWKDENSALPDNYGLAYGRLRSLINRIKPEDALLVSYDKNIQEKLRKKIIEVAPEQPDGTVHYIPHQAVVTPSKKTTKLRIVFDASAKTSKDGRSVNECLYRGPVFLADSVGIILRWRLPKIAFVGDIEKAFLQVGLQQSERDITRFLWLKDARKPPNSGNIQVFRFCRVPFGFISSPFLLAASILHHMKTTGSRLSSKIRDNIYVDNVFGGAVDEAEAYTFYKDAKDLFARMSMNLREWCSNSKDFLKLIPEIDRGDCDTTSVLGLKWNLLDDTFHISAGRASNQIINWTKRRVLQTIASVFDPCGLLSPVTVKGKLLMQELWKDKCGWDDAIPEPANKSWSSYLPDLMKIPELPIPRQMRGLTPNSQLELHCFCDASSKAFAAVIYLRSSQSDVISTNLVFTKTRVAPIKPVSIPRLELLAVLIGVRCLKFVNEQLKLQVRKQVVWTDSSCVLHWIAKDQVSTVFVQNRIREIRTHCDVQFRFVATHENPADLPTRGIGLTDLQSSTIWWCGPTWLSHEPDTWPPPLDVSQKVTVSSVIPEIQALTTPSVPERGLILNPASYSSRQHLFRTTSYIFRFVRASRKQGVPPDDVISAQELESAKQWWDKEVQQRSFPQIHSPSHDNEFRNLHRQLGIVTDSQGLLRCQGSYASKESKDEAEFPLLMPKNNPYTDLIIRETHERLLHAGVKHTLAELRQEYWVIHARNQIKRVIRSCRICKFYDGGHFRIPKAASLPDFRLTKQKPFQVVGIDHMGPLFVKENIANSSSKVWICLFTCATVRAIHLEIVEALSTEQFLLGFRRFVALYGIPTVVVSDNAKQFHSAERVLSRIWREIFLSKEVNTFSATRGITWKFITELAPWMGGFYERMGGLVKSALKKTIHNRSISLVELQTVICEITSLLNSRPLLYSEESPEGDYLSPAHFLGRNTELIPAATSEEEYSPQPITADTLIKKWKRIQAILDGFWVTWQSSYLQNLQQSIWQPSNRNVSHIQPALGTVVIIKDKPHRGSWRTGRVINLIASHDGICRAADVRLSTGVVIRRPFKLLFPLECSAEPPGIVAKISRAHLSGRAPSSRAAAAVAQSRIRHQSSAQSSDEDS